MNSPAQIFAAHLIANLARYGSQFWLAPGARSQSLAIAAAQLAEADLAPLRIRIDERSLGFSALGAAVSSKPQVVITTSGTAVANLHPAVLEAHHSGVPLILLTADRPVELRGVGSNQTTNQVGIFGDAVIDCIDVSAPTDSDDHEQKASALAKQIIDKAFTSSQPIQVNLQFREPLSAAEPDAVEIYNQLADFDLPKITQSKKALQLSNKAVVIAGANSHEFEAEIADLGLPVFAEPSSGVRHLANSVISYRFLLKAQDELVGQIDQVVVYGKPTLSRPVIALLRSGIEVLVRPSRMGNFAIPESRKVVAEAIESQADPTWLASWLVKDQLPEPTGALDRQAIVQTLWQQSENTQVILGASQMIREADHYAGRQKVLAFANRGLAGIDGTIATATGMAVSTGKKVRALLGDLTFQHDVGSLAVDPLDGELDIALIVVNDHGGKIFEYLEVAQTVSKAIYERVFKTEQFIKIDDLAKGFGWQYLKVDSLAEYEKALQVSGRVIIEIELV